MNTANDLKNFLQSINRKSYPTYKSLRGAYKFSNFILSIDHVQGDPFASPSHISVKIPHSVADFPTEYYKDSICRTTLADFLTRQFEKEIYRYSFRAKGSGKSGLISITHCGQEILSRTACEITSQEIIARFLVGFPANGRTINSPELEKIFFEFLPKCVEHAFFYKNTNTHQLKEAIFLAEDQTYIRQQLKIRKLAAFVADGAILPRESGVSAKPMSNSVPFSSPESLRITLDLPHHGSITGMGIPCGITLIAGGGYHGKSTLLQALELGVYNHIPGDGREYVITDDTALKLRSEDGRFIKDVDISLFINNLPNHKDTYCFCTEDASGSTSQAAGIIEGIESNCRLILLDEDTSATNSMVRDSFMQEVICREKEPITPFLDRAVDLYKKLQISTILVAGSSGAFFHIADTIIQMDNYKPIDITTRTKALCAKYPLPESCPAPFSLSDSKRIMTKPHGLQTASHSRRHFSTESAPGTDRDERIKVKTHGKREFSIGKQDVDLRYIEQLIDTEQTSALGLLTKYACEHLIDGKKTVSEIAQILADELSKNGLNKIMKNDMHCGYALPRIQEIYSCLNRIRR